MDEQIDSEATLDVEFAGDDGSWDLVFHLETSRFQLVLQTPLIHRFKQTWTE